MKNDLSLGGSIRTILLKSTVCHFFFKNKPTSWLKRNDMDISATSKSKPTGPTSKIRVCSDPRLSFMTSYEIIADDIEHRWSLTMLVFDTNGSILQSERDVDASNCNQLISKAIRDLRKIG
uniref:Uncharacterized protein n=1 Tax=Pseudo-nitzschia australis TaxID=44445 RepID=A0A7S4EQ73_9STRA